MNKILVGLDGSPNSFKALEEAINLSKFYNAELHTISVEEIPHFSETIDEIEEEKDIEDSKYNEIIVKAKEFASAKDYPVETHIIMGHEVKMIVDYIKKYKFDLLVVGFVGRSAVFERVMGSTSQSLVRMVACSVLIVK